MRVAVAIELTDNERAALTKWSRGRSTPARLVLRAKIVLLAADGLENKQIAAQLNCKRETVGKWRNRFATHRFHGVPSYVFDMHRPQSAVTTSACRGSSMTQRRTLAEFALVFVLLAIVGVSCGGNSPSGLDGVPEGELAPSGATFRWERELERNWEYVRKQLQNGLGPQSLGNQLLDHARHHDQRRERDQSDQE